MLKDINDPAVEEEMERELNTIAKLDHENIVRIYGVFSVADTGNTGKLNILSDSFQIMRVCGICFSTWWVDLSAIQQ